LFMVTSGGGLARLPELAAAPIHSINSGPAMAPIAGRVYARETAQADTAIIVDSGGTSFDVTLLRSGRIPVTRETWLGDPYFGHMTGFPSIDVRSIGAGGGSIAHVDDGGLLHVGPDSAGADPGPACYGRGGTQPTLTDACLVLGYLDSRSFLGGAITLDPEAAERAVRDALCPHLQMDARHAAAAVLELATEQMVRAIEDTTVWHGLDTGAAILVAGGGAAGFNAAAIARRLGCQTVVIPRTGAALSAVGGLLSPLRAEFAAPLFTSSDAFAAEAANELLAKLLEQAKRYLADAGADGGAHFELLAEARYPRQIWELEVPLTIQKFTSAADVEQLCTSFHTVHQETFAVSDPVSPIEVVSVRVRLEANLRGTRSIIAAKSATAPRTASRDVFFPGVGEVETRILSLDGLAAPDRIHGPCVIEAPFTTIIVEPEATAALAESGDLIIWPFGRESILQ
jgi:N-methylhydantoinase A